jgi:hypothetical protein
LIPGRPVHHSRRGLTAGPSPFKMMIKSRLEKVK